MDGFMVTAHATTAPQNRSASSSRITPPFVSGAKLLGSLADFRKSPQGFVLKLQRELGDAFVYRNAFWTTWLFAHPDQIKHVLQDNSRNYNKDTLNWKNIRAFFGNSSLTADGEPWVRRRRLVQPSFHNDRLVAVAQIVTEATDEMLVQWDKLAQRGQPVDVAAEMMSLTLKVVGSALFSSDLLDEAEVIDQATAGILEYFERQVTTALPMPLNVPTKHNRKFKANMKNFHRAVLRITNARRARDVWPDDLLTMLLTAREDETGNGMSATELLDEVVTMIFAGYETTATALAWTWFLLSKYPEVTKRLELELEQVLHGDAPTFADLPELRYAQMVFQESMRLYPPVWILTRKAISDDVVGGYDVASGTVVALSPYVTHRHSAFWENPEAFVPERFAPELMQRRPRYSFFPFGGGPRQCVGHAFAQMEAALIIAMVAQRYRLHLVPGHNVKPLPLGILRPMNGVPMTLHRRT
jgi:cytochrome P450